MNKQQLFQEIGDIDEELVEAALLEREQKEIEGKEPNPQPSENLYKSLKKGWFKYWWRWSGIAAGILVLIVIGSQLEIIRFGSGFSSGSGMESAADEAADDLMKEDVVDDLKPEDVMDSEVDSDVDKENVVDRKEQLAFTEVALVDEEAESLGHPLASYDLTQEQIKTIIPDMDEEYDLEGTIHFYILNENPNPPAMLGRIV